MQYIAKLKTKSGAWKIIEYECEHKKGSKANTATLEKLMKRKFGEVLDIVEIITKPSESNDKSNDYDYYFGKNNWKEQPNKYITFKHLIDDENIIIVTSNIKYFKNSGKYIMAIGNNSCIWLKEWQIKKCYNYWLDTDAHIVKLNKKYYTPYALKFTFDELNFEKDETWEDMIEIAKEQDQVNEKWDIRSLNEHL